MSPCKILILKTSELCKTWHTGCGEKVNPYIGRWSC